MALMIHLTAYEQECVRMRWWLTLVATLCVSQALRQFFERVSWELSYPLLFCSCPDQACAERRRRTIVPSCSHQERHKPNCLELRRTCRSDALCRWDVSPWAANQVWSCPDGFSFPCIYGRLFFFFFLAWCILEEEQICEISCYSVWLERHLAHLGKITCLLDNYWL